MEVFFRCLFVLLTRSMSRHVLFKLEPTALSLKLLPKYTRDRSPFLLNSHDLVELSNNLKPFLLPCCFNHNNFLSLSPRFYADAECRKVLKMCSGSRVCNYLPFYGSNFRTGQDWNTKHTFTHFSYDSWSFLGFNSNSDGGQRRLFYDQKSHYALDYGKHKNPCSVFSS